MLKLFKDKTDKTVSFSNRVDGKFKATKGIVRFNDKDQTIIDFSQIPIPCLMELKSGLFSVTIHIKMIYKGMVSAEVDKYLSYKDERVAQFDYNNFFDYLQKLQKT